MQKTNGKLSLLLYVIGRWARSIPVILAMLLIVLAFPFSWGDGPLWAQGYYNITTNARKNYLSEIFYYSNYVEPTDQVNYLLQLI